MPNFSIRAAATALLALAAMHQAHAQPAPAPQPAARWHLDGSTDRCLLSRRLEGTPVPATFILRTIPGSGRYDVILAAPDLSADVRRPGRPAVLELAPGGEAHRGTGRAVDLPGALGRGVAFGPLSAAFAAELGRASSLRLADGEGRALGSWTIPLAGRAAEAMAYCEAEKQVEWGADPAGFEPGATPPRPAGDPADWLGARDFGLATSLTPAAYSAVFRLVLDERGRATDCRLLESAGNVDLAGACRGLASRARYEPARDPRGIAVRSVAIHIVSVRMELDIVLPPR
ncbi:MAG TPA: hypothetical protein VF702_07710 [Allosphingosinicella sp.]